MPQPTVRRQDPYVPLTKEQFRERFYARFYDPSFDEVRAELEKVFEKAWEGYIVYRKSPRQQPAGPGYADPAHKLPVEWLDTPQGRAPLGPAQTVERITALPLPPAPRLPRWSLSLLAAPQDGKIVYGGMVSRSWGPLTGTVGHVAGLTFTGGGFRW